MRYLSKTFYMDIDQRYPRLRLTTWMDGLCTKWPIFCRQDFEIDFLGWKSLYLDCNFTEFCSKGCNLQHMSALIQIMAWWRADAKSLTQRLMTQLSPLPRIHRADCRFAPSQWETAILCSGVSHWMGANMESPCIHINKEARSLLGFHTKDPCYLLYLITWFNLDASVDNHMPSVTPLNGNC